MSSEVHSNRWEEIKKMRIARKQAMQLHLIKYRVIQMSSRECSNMGIPPGNIRDLGKRLNALHHIDLQGYSFECPAEFRKSVGKTAEQLGFYIEQV